MAGKQNFQEEPDSPKVYQIRVQGRLDQLWTGWLEGMTISQTDDGETLLTGPVVDQAALHGLLKKVRDLGLTLIAINQINPD